MIAKTRGIAGPDACRIRLRGMINLMPTSCRAVEKVRHPATTSANAQLCAGLLAPEASVAPKYLYDVLGSRLFEAICLVPEYYPTRTEAAIFARHGAQIAAHIGTGSTMIDLGAGNCAKAAGLFAQLAPAHYVAVDISLVFLQQALANLRQRFPALPMSAVGLDFSAPFTLPEQVPEARRLFFYPGSSIGNFEPAEALLFLQGLRRQCGPDGGLLIGVDLIKDGAILQAAYDDAAGVTAAFNLNLLNHVNTLIGANFDLYGWRHRCVVNQARGRVELYLEARSDQQVVWEGGQRLFAAGERIHTENSHKYRVPDFLATLSQAGFGQAQVWTDPRQWFAVIHATALG